MLAAKFGGAFLYRIRVPASFWDFVKFLCQPQAMPDLSQLTERGAKAWTAVDAQALREGFTAADMATASAQGFRDGVASVAASAGGPTCDMRTVVAVAVTMLYDTHPEDVCRVFDRNDLETIVSITEPLGHGRVEDIYRDAWDHVAAPPTAQAEGWTKLPGQLPEPGMPVLLDIGKKYPIRAMWTAKHTVQASDDDPDWGEYVEADDMYYAPEGWYEWNQCEENHWRVTETPRAWMPLPPPPTSAEGVEHG